MLCNYSFLALSLWSRMLFLSLFADSMLGYIIGFALLMEVFSCNQSFKEMVAMCLVKDQTKRPTAEKLLKHSFFKNAKPPELTVKSVLTDLPPLWDRVKAIQVCLYVLSSCFFLFNACDSVS